MQADDLVGRFVSVPAEFLNLALFERLTHNGKLVGVQLLFKDNTQKVLENDALTDEVRRFVERGDGGSQESHD